MKPLILEFAETPEILDLDNSILEYSEELNLTVLKSTKEVAIEKVYLETETFTKSIGEGTDKDQDDYLNHIMDTLTKTGVKSEESDADDSINDQIVHLMETTTYTFTNKEETDADKDIEKIKKLMDTRTITEIKREESDTD